MTSNLGNRYLDGRVSEYNVSFVYFFKNDSSYITSIRKGYLGVTQNKGAYPTCLGILTDSATTIVGQEQCQQSADEYICKNGALIISTFLLRLLAIDVFVFFNDVRPCRLSMRPKLRAPAKTGENPRGIDKNVYCRNCAALM